MSRESIIKAFEGVNVRIVWDDETEEYYFAVNDIVQVLTESSLRERRAADIRPFY